MFWQRPLREHPEYRQGVKDMAPQVLGLAAWGLMTGVAMLKTGLTIPEALAMTLLVYAGSAQLAALPLLLAGAPAWVILATGFCVNLRFVVFSLHLRPYLMHMPRWRRLVTGYFTTDMSYVLHTRRYPQPPQDSEQRLAQEAYLAGNCGLNWAAWQAASLLGIALANFVPTAWGLGFAGILCLVGILCSLATARLRLVAGAVAGATAVAAYSMPLKLNIILAIGAAVLVCLALENRPGLAKAARP